MTKYAKQLDFRTLASKVNQMFKENRNAKTQVERTAVVNKQAGLMDQLAIASKDYDTANEVISEDNLISHLMYEISRWITEGKTSKPKNYKSKLKDENPSDLSESINTNHKAKSNGNYYQKPVLTPNGSELKVPYIKDLSDQLKELKSIKGGNRFKISKAKKQVRDDLNLAITNYRGIDEFNRTDNTPTPSDDLNLPSLNNKEYKKFLITTNLKEIRRENVRLDKITIQNEIASNSQILTDIGKGCSQANVAQRNHVAQSTVSKILKRTLKTKIE